MAEAVDAQIVALRAEAERLRQARVALLSGLLDRTIDIETAALASGFHGESRQA
jgi:hypothetical protein